MAKNLVIVESPSKAKTLKKFLGSNYKIEASVGHVRDLPKSELGINVDNDFEPKYITIRGKGEVLAKLRKEVKTADKIFLATDPDREGEAISWHLLHALKLQDKKAYRITFNEITKNAVKKSISEAREIDMNLVDAQQARRMLDRIVGYKISPLLWRKVRKRLSAGRVQSVGLKIICDREEEIEQFMPTEYWSLDLLLNLDTKKKKNSAFKVHFYGKDKKKIELNNEDETNDIIEAVKKSPLTINEIKKGHRSKKPYPPFTTSTMQQEASKSLNFPTAKTMMTAQQLYEGIAIDGMGAVGLVSYIRTDSVRISDEAYEEGKAYISEKYGDEYNFKERIEYKSKGRSQDAHEAIRPTYVNLNPDEIKDSLSKDQYRLYKLIWSRFLASQMAPASYDTVSVRLNSSSYEFRTSGSILKFDGFLKVYKPQEDGKEDANKLPELEEGSILNVAEFLPEQHFTQPPARYSEALLVRTLEELSIGRPSTYASIITTIVQRGYVLKENKVFYPTELGQIVNDIMENNFEDIVDIDFTAKLEASLDKVEDGDIPWKEVLWNFYPEFAKQISTAEEKIGEITIEDEVTDVLCENCGRNMVIKYGRFGKFLACPGFPECRNAKPYLEEADTLCPKCNKKLFIKKSKKGRNYFGCEDVEECNFMSWNKPAGENCPRCGSYMEEKGAKNTKIVCTDPKCGYFHLKEDKDEETGDNQVK